MARPCGRVGSSLRELLCFDGLDTGRDKPVPYEESAGTVALLRDLLGVTWRRSTARAASRRLGVGLRVAPPVVGRGG